MPQLMTILCILLVVWFIMLACNWTTDDGMHAILGGTLPEKRTARGVSISNVGTSALRICKVGFYETLDDARDNRNDLLKQNGDRVRFYTIGVMPLRGSWNKFDQAYGDCSEEKKISILPSTSLVIDFTVDVSFGAVRLGMMTDKKDQPSACRLQFNTSVGYQKIADALFTRAFLVFDTGDTENNAFLKVDGPDLVSDRVFTVSSRSFGDMQAAEKAKEEERLAAEKVREAERAEATRVAAEKAKEEERLAAEKAREAERAEATRVAAEKAKEAERAEAIRVAAEKAKEAERAEAIRVAAEKAKDGKAVRFKYSKDEGITDASNPESIKRPKLPLNDHSFTKIGSNIRSYALTENNQNFSNVFFSIVVDCALLPTSTELSHLQPLSECLAGILENDRHMPDPGLFYNPDAGVWAWAVRDERLSDSVMLPRTGTVTIAYVINQPGACSMFVDDGTSISTTPVRANWTCGGVRCVVTMHRCVLSSIFIWSDTYVFSYPYRSIQ